MLVALANPYEAIPQSILVGGLVQAFLLGLVVAQAVKYFTDYGDDSWRKRLYVGILVFLSILQTLIESVKLWRMGIDHLEWSSRPGLWAGLPICGILSLLCQGFFLRRCWKMTQKSLWVLVPMASLAATILLSVLSFTTTLCITFIVYQPGNPGTPPPPPYVTRATIIAFTYWVFAAFALDLCAAVIMTYKLWECRVSLADPNRVVLTIIKITLESAFLPSISSLAAVGVFHAQQDGNGTNLTLLFAYMSCKLYVLVVLRSLNARKRLRERIKSHDHYIGRTSLSMDISGWDADPPASFAQYTLEQPATQPNSRARRVSQADCASLDSIDPLDPVDILPPTISALERRSQFSTPCMDEREQGLPKALRASLSSQGKERL